MSSYESFLEAARPEIETTLDRLVPAADSPPRRIHEAMRYSLFAGGKRVRPALALMAGDALGAPREACLVGGAAVEMIHTYSLIHDDLPSLDNDDLRRGRPTLHRHFDEATAILAGDSLLTLGLTTLATAPATLPLELRCRAVALLGQAAGTEGMIGGQVDDLAAEKEWPDDAAAVLESIHRRKTGALLVVCLRLAGLYAEVDAATDAALARLGDLLGLMFQISDDILDVEGSSGALGKTAGKDAAASKLTYPGLFGLPEAKRRLLASRDAALLAAAELPGGGGHFPSLIHYLATRDR